MIAAWMLYAIAVSGALALAALAVERALTLYRQPVRLAWLAALLAGLSFPPLSLLGWLAPRSGNSLGSLVAASLPPLLASPVHAYTRVEPWAGALDAALLGAWVTATAVILASLAATFRRLRREGTGWTREELDGFPVLVSLDLGPALFGLLSTSIVVPRWFRDLPAETRKLALLHEREHLRAGDIRLLVFCLVAVALVPWNPVMWWVLRRLRAAVEMDCDYRVLVGGANPKAYAGALLEVSERTGPLGLARPALAEPKSLLSRRITAMLPLHKSTRWPWAAVYGLAALALLALACEAPPPDRAAADLTGVPTPAAALGNAYPENTPGLEPPERVSFPLPAYPKLLLEAGVEGRVLSRFVVGPDGRAEPGSIEILETSHGAFETPVRNAIAGAVFRPGRLAGKAVRVQVQMPIRFVLPKPSVLMELRPSRR
ncbi:MAG: M56 family metallopeptidase [Gemmatimonadetes bacterium]|nr:M56 family metallopeptidase [Gemmatimonadota bacterium]